MQVKKLLTMPKELWAKIEEIRFRDRFKTESDAMRHLLQLGCERQNELYGVVPLWPKPKERRGKKR